jgi:hypothetical protein
VTDLGIPRQWVRVDSSGQFLGDQFHGSLEDLERHLTRGVLDIRPDLSRSGEQQVWLHHRTRTVRCYVAVMELPWGTYRWIPDPDVAQDE